MNTKIKFTHQFVCRRRLTTDTSLLVARIEQLLGRLTEPCTFPVRLECNSRRTLEISSVMKEWQETFDILLIGENARTTSKNELIEWSMQNISEFKEDLYTWLEQELELSRWYEATSMWTREQHELRTSTKELCYKELLR